MRQSELGIAGLIVGALGAILLLFTFLIIAIHEESPTSLSDGEAAEASIGLLMIASSCFGLNGLPSQSPVSSSATATSSCRSSAWSSAPSPC